MRERTSQVLAGFENEIRAETLDDVREVVRHAEEVARGGLFVAGYVSYESAPAFDRGLKVRDRDANWCAKLPLAWFGFYRESVITALQLPRDIRGSERARWSSKVSKEAYLSNVHSILGDIAAGTVYQVNLTNSINSDNPGDHRSLYRQLLMAQEPAYGALLELDGIAVVSASPELFIEWDGTALRSRPMKGTIRRGRWPEEDNELARELSESLKETAENVMIVDLIRNDMGKVAAVGTVNVSKMCALEAFPNVWQLVSEVECVTRPATQLLDIFTAMFPCGSVTGAPKQSAMNIIEELEQSERGVYCGAIGLLSPSPRGVHARFNVAIRTAVVDQRGGQARFGSGGGIVAASQPESEYREMILKADMLNTVSPRPFRLLETFRHSPGSANDNLARHLDRLTHSAEFFGFRVRPDLAAWVASKLNNVDDEARVRLLLSRGGKLELQCAPAPEPRQTPVQLMVDEDPVFSDSIMLFHKTTRRDVYMKRRRRFPQADDVIMVNERGECTEVTIANLAVRQGATWFTPPLSSGCLPGIERARLIEQGELVETTITLEDLRCCDAVAVVNSLRGWQDAVVIGEFSTSSSDVPSPTAPSRQMSTL
ncbi:MAG TPA: aminodeoxychorismate synthase component I [Acidimicrobiales bacterium]